MEGHLSHSRVAKANNDNDAVLVLVQSCYQVLLDFKLLNWYFVCVLYQCTSNGIVLQLLPDTAAFSFLYIGSSCISCSASLGGFVMLNGASAMSINYKVFVIFK